MGAMKEMQLMLAEASAAYDAMLAINQSLRELPSHKDMTLGLHLHDYACEFGSVHIDLGRRSGKTEWIIKTSAPGDLIICANEYMRDHMKKRIYDVKGEEEGDCIFVWSIKDAIRTEFDGFRRNFNNIFIDEPSMIFAPSGIDKRKLISMMCSSYHQTFIFVGA